MPRIVIPRDLSPVLALLAAACIGVTEPSPATIRFRLDAASCRGSAPIRFYIDGTVVATQTLAAGGSVEFPVSPGEHSGAAETVAEDFLWLPPRPRSLEPRQTYTLLLAC